MRKQATKPPLSTRLLATAAAIAAGVSVAAAGGMLVRHIEKSRLHGISINAEELIKWNVEDSMETLRYAREHIEPRCTEESLYALRRLIMANRHIGQFNILNEKGEIACTTTAGLLEQPLEVPAPDVESAHGGDRFLYNFNMPIKTGNAGATTTVARLGKFAAVTNPIATDIIYASGVDAIQFVADDGKVSTIFSSVRMPKTLLGSAVSMPKGESKLKWDSALQAFSLASGTQGTRIVVKTIVTPKEIFKRYFVVIGAMLGLSLVVSFLTYAATLPALMFKNSLANRLEYLLKPENVICMLQPIIDLKTGKIAGFEALMRLKNNDEIMFPGDIIPEVMSSGLTTKFDSAVIARIAKDIESMALPAGFKVSVNFFPGSFKDGVARGLLESNFEALRARGVTVCVEVIEQYASSDVMFELEALKNAGFELSVDDFGTGFSNLGTVRQMNPHYLKIDRSFVHEMEDGTIRSSLIPEIIAIARAVNADVVAEGIENEAQATRLKEMGAEYGQGYHFAKPMSVEAFNVSLARNETYTSAA